MWAQSYGVNYIVKGLGEDWETTRVPLWENVVAELRACETILEIGCNIGMNVRAINKLQPQARITGLEINRICVDLVKKDLPYVDVIHDSLLSYKGRNKWDMVLSRGVLIHINPDALPEAYKKLGRMARKYVFLAEHYSESVEIDAGYPPSGRGFDKQDDFLWRRDFFTEFEQENPEFKRVREFTWPPDKQKTDRGALTCVLFERVG